MFAHPRFATHPARPTQAAPRSATVSATRPASVPTTAPTTVWTAAAVRLRRAVQRIGCHAAAAHALIGSALLIAAAALPAQAAKAGPVLKTDQAQAELVAHAPEGIRPGGTLQLGLKLTHQPHWHSYWKNPGDSGLPTTLDWTLPAGFQAGPIAWPVPRPLPVGPMVNYGYEGEVLLPVTVQVPADFRGTTLPVKLNAQWLVCKDVCIPEGGELTLDVPVQAATTAHAEAFARAVAQQPVAHAAADATLSVAARALRLEVGALPAAWKGQALWAFTEEPGIVDHAAPAPEPAKAWNGDRWTAEVPIQPQRAGSPTEIAWVLRPQQPGAAGPAGVRVVLPLTGAWPPDLPMADAHAAAGGLPTAAASGSGGVPSVATSDPAGAATTTAAPAGLLGLLAFALIGGALLNLMPCVFPVLSLKVLGLARQGGSPADRWRHAGVYAAGVVLGFVALAAVLLALRAGGEQLGWGFQLQSPWVVALLATLFTLIGLNLFGVFEVGTRLAGQAASVQHRHPTADAFLTGLLAVAVASPCTAPFMGASLGAAATLPAAQALLVFAALGVGMALPFVLLTGLPALTRWLPKPGVWMQHLRTAFAFPMLATVVWLLWVLGQQVGIDGAAAVLALQVAVAAVAWAFGRRAEAQPPGWGWKALSALALAGVLAWAWPVLRPGSADGTASAATPIGAGAGAGAGAGTTATAPGQPAGWQPWQAERVAALLAEGRPVFVDFTAAWCVTCQYNKRTVLADAEVLAALDAKGVVRLRADWTRRDPAITQALAALGRNGVPVYALYRPGVAQPLLLSEMPSRDELRAAAGGLAN